MDIDNVEELVEREGIVFLVYGKWMTQTLIAGVTEGLEKETEKNHVKMGAANNIYTIFIELSQNMMNYSKDKAEGENLGPKSEGIIIVSKNGEHEYIIHSQNVVDLNDRAKIEPKLQEIMSLDRDGLKKRYRELRRSGRDTHSKGGGIGFYEIAKRCAAIDYEFKPINKTKMYFHFKAIISVDARSKAREE